MESEWQDIMKSPFWRMGIAHMVFLFFPGFIHWIEVSMQMESGKHDTLSWWVENTGNHPNKTMIRITTKNSNKANRQELSKDWQRHPTYPKIVQVTKHWRNAGSQQ